MPKFTLLEMTQKVLSSIDGDEVNSITDTVESEQVADVIERSYWNLLDNKVIPDNNTLLNMESPSDSSRPTHLFLPTGVDKVSWIRYNVVTVDETDIRYELIPYVTPEEFLQDTLTHNSSDDSVVEVDENGTTLLIKNDGPPTFWTSFDDKFMVFNSFDSDVDTHLQASKTMAFGAKEPTWTKEDTFVPDLNANLFSALLNDAISLAHIELKQTVHQKAEKNARTSRARQQSYRYNFEEAGGGIYPNYGR